MQHAGTREGTHLFRPRAQLIRVNPRPYVLHIVPVFDNLTVLHGVPFLQ